MAPYKAGMRSTASVILEFVLQAHPVRLHHHRKKQRIPKRRIRRWCLTAQLQLQPPWPPHLASLAHPLHKNQPRSGKMHLDKHSAHLPLVSPLLDNHPLVRPPLDSPINPVILPPHLVRRSQRQVLVPLQQQLQAHSDQRRRHLVVSGLLRPRVVLLVKGALQVARQQSLVLMHFLRTSPQL
jgi:hypothetical protein